MSYFNFNNEEVIRCMKNGMTQDLRDGDVGTLLHLFAQNGAVNSVSSKKY